MKRSKTKKLPPLKQLHKLFSYDPETGLLTRKVTTSGNSKAGSVVGCRQGQPGKQYLAVGIGQKLYKVHRIIWKLVTGEDPGEYDVDHKDRDACNNRWSNLRLDKEKRNRQNTEANRGCRFKGVQPRANGTFYATIQAKKKRFFLGSFKTAEEAACAYNEASLELHGEWGFQNAL